MKCLEEQISDILTGPTTCPACGEACEDASGGHVPYWMHCGTCTWQGDREDAIPRDDRDRLATLRAELAEERRALARKIEAEETQLAATKLRLAAIHEREQAEIAAEAARKRDRLAWLRSPQAVEHVAAVRAEAARIVKLAVRLHLTQAADRLEADIAKARGPAK